MSTHYTLGDIFKSVGAIAEQDASLPTGTDLTQRIQFANDALAEWADTYTWTDLRKTLFVNPTESIVSLGLEVNFRQPLSPLVEYRDNGEKVIYEMTVATDRFNKEITDNFCYIDGVYGNKALVIPNGITANASLQMDYISYPSSLATFTDSVPITATQYMVKKVTALVLQGRGDPRFPTIMTDAQRMLSNAIEEQNVPFGRINTIPTVNDTFTIGVN